jgi:5'-methylthioinosine phosphorylase
MSLNNTKVDLAIIGGTGLYQIGKARVIEPVSIVTPYGTTSQGLSIIDYLDRPVAFLPRHGAEHSIPPHLVNYRANIWGLKELGVEVIYASNAVGAIDPQMDNGDLVIPDQIIDYTWGRAHTFFDGSADKQPKAPQGFIKVDHIDFTYPYSLTLRKGLIEAAKGGDFKVHHQGAYAAVQGPRLETAAEVKRLAKDGATIVGMTGMPETALARELGIDYAAIAMVVNMAAGINPEPITLADIEENMLIGKRRLEVLLARTLAG